MRLSLYTASRGTSPRSEALLHGLEGVGHEVSASRIQARRLGRDRLVRFPAHGPYTGHGVPFSPGDEPEVLFAATSRVVGDADRAADLVGGWVARRPDWSRAGRDHAWAVPEHPELSVPAGAAVPEVTPWNAHRGRRPDPGPARRLALCFRSTPASPAHPLRAALERAGAQVIVSDRIDTGAEVDAFVVVESPDPPLEVTGTIGVPVVYWVHHGEHHLPGNVRLARRYQADLVLLAHSWHLALRFDRPVERFPFGVTPEVAAAARPYDERTFDAAFVGSVEGGAYERRRALLSALEAQVGSMTVRSDLAAERVGAVYGDARMVLNDGGTRHQPITMRVFEATGSGALLLSEPAPGLDLLFGGSYVPLEGEPDPLPDRTEAARLAAAAREEALDAHTYDHRAALLLRLLDGLGHADRGGPTRPRRAIDEFLDRHPHGQRILDAAGIVDAPDREVWSPEDLSAPPPPGTFDTVVVDDRPEPWMLAAARRFVVGRSVEPADLQVPVRSVEEMDDLAVIALDAPGYHVDTVGGVPGPSPK